MRHTHEYLKNSKSFLCGVYIKHKQCFQASLQLFANITRILMAPKLTELAEMGHETDENVIYESFKTNVGFIL